MDACAEAFDDRPVREEESTALSGSREEPDSPASSPPTEWNPRLTAVMVAGRSSLATIDGRILKVGEQVDGVRLVSVRDSEVVVVRDGQRHVLTMAAPGPVSIKNRGEQ